MKTIEEKAKEAIAQIEAIVAEVRENKQPKPDHDFVEELRMYFEKTPREKVLEDWEKTKEVEIPDFPINGYAKITRTSMKIEGISESDKKKPLKIIGRKGSQLILDGICRGVEWDWCEPCLANGQTKPDLSIINDTDWFYVESAFKWLFRGKMFENHESNLAYSITNDIITTNHHPLCCKKDITLIRKATDQDLAPFFAKYPEYASWKPSKGQYFVAENAMHSRSLCILKEIRDNNLEKNALYIHCHVFEGVPIVVAETWFYSHLKFTPATEDEIKMMDDALAKKGKRFNKDTNQIEDIPQEPVIGDMVIAWNNYKKEALIGKLSRIDDAIPYIVSGFWFSNIIKFKNIEQYEQLLKEKL